ncbi:MAG: alanine--tRNA ligase [Acidobacteriota bacterium]
MPTTSDIREEFLRYFESNQHRRVASSSLVPAGDPTLLFTNAGMNQFKDVFLGRERRDYSRATSSQKCVRAGGKHNDLENVGRTARHHTFFEMLGNFSFGDYFKKGAIKFAWELITEVYGLDVNRLWFTVFEGDDSVPADDEAARLWIEAGASQDRVLRFGKNDNFWSMGDTGPCGPCSEIHYFRGDDLSKNVPALVNGPGDDTMEVWNLVFMQYDRDASGNLTSLPAPSVDTGAGLERLASILQNVDTNYDIDIFEPLMVRIEVLSGHRYSRSMSDELDTAVRVLCDHARAAVFLISDGVIPSNEGRGYVLRRIIRRATRFGRKLPQAVVLSELVDAVVEAMVGAYPELTSRRPAVLHTLQSEEERFSKTLSVGIERVGDVLDQVRQRGERVLGGEEVFRLYDTFGIPVDLIEELGEDEGVGVDRQGFEEQMSAARMKAKASSRFQNDGSDELFAAIAARIEPTDFVGYDNYENVQGRILSIVAKEQEHQEVPAGEEGEVVVSPTPFYAESGGQIADTGTLVWDGGSADVLDTQKQAGDLTVSRVKVTAGTLRVGQSVQATVPRQLRLDTTANHTATHLLHQALKDVLGPTVQQAGSLVEPQRLRFDYTYGKPISNEQIRAVEEIVNDRIRQNLEVKKTIMPLAEAKKSGAVAMFGEKYGDSVRIVEAVGYSKEFCGGCHVNRTGDIGLMKVVSDRSLAAGVRRMEALTGRGAIEYFQSLDSSARHLQQQLNAPLIELPSLVRSMQEKQKTLDKELKSVRMKLASAGNGGAERSSADDTIDVGGIKLLARNVEEMSGGDLRNLADTFRHKIRSGVVLLGTKSEGKATLLAAVTSDLVDRISARSVIEKLAPIVGGKGGGRADLAQAGGKLPEKLDEAIRMGPEVVRELLGVPD